MLKTWKEPAQISEFYLRLDLKRWPHNSLNLILEFSIQKQFNSDIKNILYIISPKKQVLKTAFP